MVPGKEALSAVNQAVQKKFQVTLNATAIVEAMLLDEVPKEMRELVENLDTFIAS